MFSYLVSPLLTLFNHTQPTSNPNDFETNSNNLKQETETKEQEGFLKTTEDLEKVNPYIEQPEFIRLYSLEELTLEKKELIKKIKLTAHEKSTTGYEEGPPTKLAQMLYAFHITKEMERRKQVEFTENERALINQYHEILKLKYGFWVRNI